jgi:hypothetical protein
MPVRKFSEARLARYILVRDVLARIVCELGCTEAEAAFALSGFLIDAGDRAPNWFDIQPLEAGLPFEPFKASELSLMLYQLQLPDSEYDPRLTKDEIWDVWGGDEGGKQKLLIEHCDVQFYYAHACFRREEIEPMLRDAGLLAEALPPSVRSSVSDGCTIVATGVSSEPPAKVRKARVRLSAADHQTIREKCVVEGRTHQDVADEYGVVRQTVTGIVKRAEANVASPFRPRKVTMR